MDKSAAIAQIEKAIAKCDVEASGKMGWDPRLGITNPKVKQALARRHSLLLALEAVKAS